VFACAPKILNQFVFYFKMFVLDLAVSSFLAPKRHAAVAAVAGADIDLGFIEEFHGL
jgi:hypothetical protein